MNINRLESLIKKSGYSKLAICKQCGFTSPTLDSALKGADIKISTLIALAKFFKVPVGYFFDETSSSIDKDIPTSSPINERLISIIESQQRTIQNLTSK